MSEGELNALTFMSTVVVGGPISLQTLYYKKKKKAIEQDVVKVTMEHVSMRIKNERYLLVYEVLYIMIVNL